MSATEGARNPGAVVLAGALDTKGAEYGFVRDRLVAAGVETILLDTGVQGEPMIVADIDRSAVARAADADVAELAAAGDRGAAVDRMARGAVRIVADLHARGRVGGLLVLGGSNAGYVMSHLAPALPIGPPKVLVSTIVAGDTRPYVGVSDLTMMYPVLDIAGLNSISTPLLARAADACAGMLLGSPVPQARSGPGAVACTMFGVTTPCVTAVREHVEGRGLEGHVFHATGTGGRAMEAMIDAGLFAAVADLTTTELADELLGGVCSAGPHRLEAAARRRIPQVVSVGALDMCNFGPRESVPRRFVDRVLFEHNPAVTLMRTDPAENTRLGRVLARKVNASTAPVEVVVPTGGFSQISTPGGPFHDPGADTALVDALRAELADHVPLHLVDSGVNDAPFSAAVADILDRILPAKGHPA